MPSLRYRFGDFLLDPANRELYRDGEMLSLRRKVFDCLVYLVEHRERVVDRDELIEAVWNNMHLSGGVLAQAIAELRRALDDSGEDPYHVKTVRGVGYRWAASTEVIQAPAATGIRAHLAARRAGLALAAASLALLLVAMLFITRGGRHDEVAVATTRPVEGGLSLLLPVEVAAEEGDSWLRLGLMELMAERLRAADESMVPGDTVIALLRGVGGEPGPELIAELGERTGAGRVLAARVEFVDPVWRVRLRSVHGPEPRISALGESGDVLEAARLAADRIALSLGRTPAPAPASEPGLERLLQQAEAAILAERHDVARALIESADPALRRQPAVHRQLARIELHSLRLDSAQAILESLLRNPAVELQPALRARILRDLSAVHFQRADLDAAEAVLGAALETLTDDSKGITGAIQRSLGLVRLMRGDFDQAKVHLAQARRALEGTGDMSGLATLDNNLGLLEALRERYAEARMYFESAANRDAALHHVSSELRNWANTVEAHLGLLEPRAALALKPRMEELLERTDNPDSAAHARLAIVYLLAANGQVRDAERRLNDLLRDLDSAKDLQLHLPLARALAFQARWRQRREDTAGLTELAGDVLQRLPADSALVADERGQAWLVLVRARLSTRDFPAAAGEVAAMTAWAEQGVTLPPRLYAVLAQAELAAATGEREVAAVAFEQALVLAESSHVPLRMVQVAERYVPWLIASGRGGDGDPERALVVAGRVNAYADRDFGAALVQLRVYGALGPASAWRTALDQARSLAGERALPASLLAPPPVQD